LAKYILKGLVTSVEDMRRKKGLPMGNIEEVLDEIGRQPYQAIPPLVASFRNCDPTG
jgi:hypothetical protein